MKPRAGYQLEDGKQKTILQSMLPTEFLIIAKWQFNDIIPIFCVSSSVYCSSPQRWCARVQYIPRNMHTVLLCFASLWLCDRSQWIHMKYLSIFIRVALLEPGQSLDCHSQCQWSKPDGYGKISQCITTTKHSKAKTLCTFLGIYCSYIALPLVFLKGSSLVARKQQYCMLSYIGRFEIV